MTELNIKVPLSTVTGGGYDANAAKAKYAANSELIKQTYHYEKFMGKRKKDGALKLASLKPEHKQYISAAINGMKGVEIADHFSVPVITVYRVLSDPLARSLIAEFEESLAEEFRRMFPMVSDAIRDGLESGSPKVKLLAADRWLKIRKFIDGGENDEGTEKRSEAVSVARTKFVEMVKTVTETSVKSTVIEMEAVEVK